jgi:hypothetical protein
MILIRSKSTSGVVLLSCSFKRSMRALSALTRAVEAALVVFVFSVVFFVFVILFVSCFHIVCFVFA